MAGAISVGDINDDYYRLCIYGQNRTGKTTLACQFPKPLLLVGCEPNPTGGAKSVKKFKDVTFLKIEDTASLMKLFVELKTSNPFATVVIDSVTSVQDIVLREILNLPEIPAVLNWGMVDMEQYRQRSEKTRELLRPFLTRLPCHVVVTAKERDHNPPKDGNPQIIRGVQQESFFSVDLGGQTAGWLQDTCDVVTQLYIEKEYLEEKYGEEKELTRLVETGKSVRKLRIRGTPNYFSGIRSAAPENVPEFILDPTFDKLKKVING